jgi:hypothetical protein
MTSGYTRTKVILPLSIVGLDSFQSRMRKPLNHSLEGIVLDLSQGFVELDSGKTIRPNRRES